MIHEGESLLKIAGAALPKNQEMTKQGSILANMQASGLEHSSTWHSFW